MTQDSKPSDPVWAKISPDSEAAYQALRENQFIPYFQPIVTLRTGQLASFEVLARWLHPTAGLIPPDKFIPIAERDGWIGALTHQILERAFLAASVIPYPLGLAINISPFQLRDLTLPSQIRDLGEKTGFPPYRLVIEITESALIEDLQSASAIVAELKGLGCRVALDDFGTGYSSLHHLQSLPFNKLKVDRSFVSSMTEKRGSRKIVSAVVGLGQSLGLITVAEGIETQEQAEMLLRLGCDLGQGYFYGRPMPAEDLFAAISAHREPIVTGDFNKWHKSSAPDLDLSPSCWLAQLQAIYAGAPIGLAFIDQNLRYVNLNSRLASMNGGSLESHLGSKVSDVQPELYPSIEPYIERALSGVAICDIEATHPTTGETLSFSYEPAFDEAGEVVGVLIAAVDVTARKRTQQALDASEAHYREMVELNPQNLWIMDAKGHSPDVSPRWDKVTGRMIDQPPSESWLTKVHPGDRRATAKAVAASRRNGEPIDVQYRVADGKGGWVWKQSIGTPRFDPSGNIVCWFGSVHDIQVEDAQVENAPVQTPHVPNLVLPLQPAPLLGNAVGRRPDETSTVFRMCSSPAAVERSSQRSQALAELDILDTPPEEEFDDLVALASEISNTPISLVSLLDTERQWFKASIGVEFSETPIGVSFCSHAIEQHGLFLVEDAAADERFKHNPLVTGGPSIRFYAGMPLYAGEGVAVGTLCVLDTRPRTLSPGQAKALAILSHQVQARMELRAERRKLLSAIEANEQLTAELTHNNQILEIANSQLERLATTDSLTGILNRRAFEERIAAAFSSAVRKHRPLSLVVMDIDNFKKRNDQFGHAAGDDALRNVGEVLRNVLRAEDSAARTGGEEFAVILPDTTPEDAFQVARRVQELLGVWGDKRLPRLTVSVGIACIRAETQDWEGMFRMADRAMYEAKQEGRDRIVMTEARNVA